MLIHTDIETIPAQRADVRARLLDEAAESARTAAPPSNYKKPDAIDRWRIARIDAAAHDGDEQWRKTALDGGYGEIVCICWAIDDGDVQAAYRGTVDGNEADVLGLFFDAIKAETLRFPSSYPTFVGHNLSFDLRFLHHRAVVLGMIRPPVTLPYNATAWSGRYMDTQYEWCGQRDFIKLTVLCDMLGIDVGADDIDGSQVWDRFQAGDIQSIVEHCRADVERVRQVAARLMWVGREGREED